ncbi:aldo/keto reductase [Pseudorhodoferax sp.]|uniref:aldo/keto reductase n=1 Tax=Pseudorhodoferax sp. TaxID=1993553 RepID=UPI0039E31C3C
MPALALGCARIGSALTPLGRHECVALLEAALALGVRHFDTASIYGQGDSERYLGEALHAHRAQVHLASKAGQRLTAKQAIVSQFKGPIRWLAARRGTVHRRVADQRAQGVPRCFEPDYVERSLAASLKRLKTDYLDVFYLHSPDASVLDDDRLMQRLLQLRARGMVRAIGVSCDEHDVAWKAARHDAVEVVQFAFDGGEPGRALLRALAERGKRGVLRGFLSAAAQGAAMPQSLVAAFGQAFTLPAVEGVLVGTTRLEHLQENVQAYRRALAVARSEGAVEAGNA